VGEVKGLALRPYQTEAIQAVKAGFQRGLARVAVVLPTGMGKTIIFANIIKDAVERFTQPIVLVHRDELVNQAIDKLKVVAPEITIGVVKAERNQTDEDVIIASIQTLGRSSRLADFMEAIADNTTGPVIVDEAHHAAADSYVRVMNALGCYRTDGQHVPAIGFTATMKRGDARGLGDVWQETVYTKDILFGISRGYLSDVKGRRITVDGLDLREVAITRGDYREGQLGDAMVNSGAGEVIAEAYKEHASDRQGILFTPTVHAAYEWAVDLENAGIPTAVIEGNTPTEDRKLIYKKYAEGEIQVLSNCMVLTEGFDMPQASCAVIARPTSLPGLYTQMVGRVLRPWPGRDHALVLDVVGVASRVELATLNDLSETKVKEIKEGETLAEAATREAEEEPSPIRVGKVGELAGEHVDLFHTSRSVWLKTKAGLWFIPTRDWTFFLWPEGVNQVSVGRIPNKGTSKADLLLKDINIEYGMSWAEQEAAEIDPSISNKAASWRQRSRTPSEAQLNMANIFRIDISDKPSRGELSDRISIKMASRRLDRFLS
jgi:superfamily II DNA or RNA helicase